MLLLLHQRRTDLLAGVMPANVTNSRNTVSAVVSPPTPGTASSTSKTLNVAELSGGSSGIHTSCSTKATTVPKRDNYGIITLL